MKPALTLVTLCLFALSAGAQPPAPAPAAPPASAPIFGGEVVARGKGFVITRGQLDEAVIAHKANAAARGVPVPADKTAEIERQVLERLVNVELLKARVTAEDRTDAAARVERIYEREKAKAPSESAFNRQIQALGMTLEKFREQLAERALVEEVMDRELRPAVKIPPEQVRKFYDENAQRFTQGEQVKVRHIFFTTFDLQTGQPFTEERKQARHAELQKLLARARAGEDFAALAKQYSEDPNSKDKGGETTFGRGMSVPEFEAASFSLGTNQISDIVTTSFGYHIIKMLEKTPPKPIEFEQVAERIKEALTITQMERLATNYFANLKKEAGVEVLLGGGNK
jgi:parvulin-like peptidyl-prolyl isomerase